MRRIITSHTRNSEKSGVNGAAVGTAIGAVAGGYAGKGIGEIIDPTTEDAWLKDKYKTRPYYREGDAFDAYRYGAEAEAKARYGEGRNEDFDTELESGWPLVQDRRELEWARARGAVKDGYDRSRAIRKQ